MPFIRLSMQAGVDNQRCIALFDRAADAVAETAIKGIEIGAAQAPVLAHHFGKQFVDP